MSRGEYGPIKITVRVVPGSSRQCVERKEDGSFRVRLRCAPEKGRANRELVEALARHFGVAKSDVSIVRGTGSRDKVVLIER